MEQKQSPVIITEEVWRNSHLSIVGRCGQVTFNNRLYKVVNKDGITVFELSDPRSRHYVGEGAMAIPPGQPCDLVRADWIPVYRALGRDRTIELVEAGTDIKEARRIAKESKKGGKP